MKEKIENILKEVHSFQSVENQEIEQFRIKYLGKKGIIAELFLAFKELSPEDKK